MDVSASVVSMIPYFRKAQNAGDQEVECRAVDKATLEVIVAVLELKADDTAGHDRVLGTVPPGNLVKLIAAISCFELRSVMVSASRVFSYMLQTAPASELLAILNMEPDFTEDEAEMMRADYEWLD